MKNSRKTLAIKIQTPGGDNPLLMSLVAANAPYYRGIPVSGLALVARGGTAPYSFSILTGTIPSGLTLHTDGTFTGTPTTSGRFTFVAEVADSASNVFPHAFSIDINALLFWYRANPIPGELGLFYTYQFVARDGAGTTLTSGYSIISGSLPPGLSLGSDGLLSGNPLSPSGISYFTIQATDGTDTITKALSITVYDEMKPDPNFNPYPLPDAVLGQEYNHKILFTGGLPPYRVSIGTDNWTAIGLRLFHDGTVKGVPTSAGLFTSSFNATDALGATSAFGYSVPITVIDPQAKITTKKDGVTVGALPGTAIYDFVGFPSVTNDGTTVTVTAPSGGSSSGISTINSIGPDSSGDFLVSSTDASITITPTPNGIDLSASVSPSAGGIQSINNIGPDSSGNFAIVSDGTIEIVENSNGELEFRVVGSVGQTAIQYQDEGSNLGTAGTADTVNFTGASITASRASNTITVASTGGMIQERINFGTGSDGVVNMDGTNTFAWASLAGGIYTLTRDVYLASGSQLSGTASIKTSGFRFFCKGTFTNNSSSTLPFSTGGSSGANATGTGGAAGGGSYSNGTLGNSVSGANGGAGGATNGSPGNAGGNGNPPRNGGGGGQGGRGGNAGANNGGNGGAVGNSTNAYSPLEGFTGGILYSINSSLTWTIIAGGGNGAGGGGGGGDGTAGGGGGGGGTGGGVSYYAIQNYVVGGGATATFSVRGYNGGNGFTPAAGNRGGGAGGGGGGGGFLVFVYETVSTTITLDASGGTGGNGAVGSGTGLAGAGGGGGAGGVINAYCTATGAATSAIGTFVGISAAGTGVTPGVSGETTTLTCS